MFETIWDLEKIREVFLKFIKEQGREPNAREIDKTPYLPTSRTIQREFGGLQELRKTLGLATKHFGKGAHRSTTATTIGKRGTETEHTLTKILIQKFGEMFVHREHPFGITGKQRIDFYIYAPEGNFGVDIFYPQDEFSMVGSVNIKADTYSQYQEQLFMVVANPNISQDSINRLVANKRKLLNCNHSVIAIQNFLTLMESKERYYVSTRAEDIKG